MLLTNKILLKLKYYLYFSILTLTINTLILLYFFDDILLIILKPLIEFKTLGVICIFTNPYEIFLTKLELFSYIIIITWLITMIHFFKTFIKNFLYLYEYKLLTLHIINVIIIWIILLYFNNNFILVEIFKYLLKFEEFQNYKTIRLEPQIQFHLYIHIIIKNWFIITSLIIMISLIIIATYQFNNTSKFYAKIRNIYLLFIFIGLLLMSPPSFKASFILIITFLLLIELLFFYLILIKKYI